MKMVVEYAYKAHESNKSDAKVKEHYDTVKRDFEGGSAATTAPAPATTSPKVVEEEKKKEEPRIEEEKT
jgi:hypothetical protein